MSDLRRYKSSCGWNEISQGETQQLDEPPVRADRKPTGCRVFALIVITKGSELAVMVITLL